MKKLRKESGLLSLEACISVIIFMFLMLFLYSFFVVFEARNEMAHVLLATTNSMSLDPYEKKISKSGDVSQIVYDLYNTSKESNGGFTSSELWDEVLKVETDENWEGDIYAGLQSDLAKDIDYAVSNRLNKAIRERFIAYLADGDEKEANKILHRFHIVDGVEGLDFSKSYISSGKLYVVLQYSLEYEYNAFGLGTIRLEQSACSKLWM